MTDIAKLCQRASQLCQEIAPTDLAGVPVYVVPVSALPDDFGTAEACIGATSPSLDLYLQSTLGSAWRGRGPAMIINDLVIETDWRAPEDCKLVFLLSVLHELAHILERDQPYRERPDARPERLTWETLLLAQTVAEPEPLDLRIPPYAQHGDSFIRTCIHVAYRACLLDVYARPSGLCAGARYGLSPACLYAEALGDEPERLAEASFREILARPPPDAFAALWNQDVADWLFDTGFFGKGESHEFVHAD